MDTPIPWIAIILGISTLAAIAMAVVALGRARAAVKPLTPEGRAEFADLPLTPLQKTATAGLVIGLLLLAGVLWIFLSKGGATTYDVDPAMRMQILGLFMISIANFTVFSALARKNADERDQRVLGWAPHAQSILLLLVVVAWCVTMPIRFHDEKSVPTIYFYLISGSAWLVYMLAFFVGILLGSWVSPRHAQS
jgi:hypothetical protein